MDSKNLSTSQLIARILCALFVTHLFYFILTSLTFNASQGFEGLIFIPLIVVAPIAILYVSLRKLSKLSTKTMVFGITFFVIITIVLMQSNWFSLYSGDGSTLQSPNLFVPSLMWDNNFEYLPIFPVTYGISILFNYTLLTVCILLSKKIFDRN